MSPAQGVRVSPRVPRPRALAPILMLAMVVSTIVLPSLSVLAAEVIVDLGLTRAGFGALVTAIAAVTAIASQWAGDLTDRLGGRRLLIMIAAIVMMSVSGMALAPGLVGLVCFAMLAGIANAGGNPASNQLIVEHLPAGGRGVTMGIKQSGVQAGYVIAGLVLPAAASAFGWRTALLALLVPALLLAVSAFAVLPRAEMRISSRRGAAGRALPSSVGRLAGYSFVMGTGTSSVTTFLPLFAQEQLLMTPSMAGATVSVLGATGVAARILIARWAERRAGFEPTLFVLAMAAAATVVLLMLGPAFGVGTLWPAVALGGVSVVAWNAVANLAAVSAAHPLVAGRASGRINLGFMAGFTVGPIVFGTLVDRTGSYEAAWSFVLVLFVAGAIIMALASERSSDTAEPAQR